MKEVKEIRNIFFSDEFKKFRASLDNRTQNKIDDCVSILKTVYVLSAKFVKRVVNTDFYEMRVSVGTNEYRTILFAIDHDNIIQATKVVLLNGFLKKDSKEYKKQINKAINIIEKLEYGTEFRP